MATRHDKVQQIVKRSRGGSAPSRLNAILGFALEAHQSAAEEVAIAKREKAERAKGRKRERARLNADRDAARAKARYHALRDDPEFRRKCAQSARDHQRRYPIAARARKLVWWYVKERKIPPARAFACVDCGEPATDYDHRDYTKPLQVQPTCRKCNLRRGPGYPYDQAEGFAK